jgi:hypothetical protein
MAEQKIEFEDWSFKPVSVGEPFDIDPSNVNIDLSLHSLLSSLTEQEEMQLEENVRKIGCLNPLMVWRKKMSQWIVVDGHYRFLICKRYNIPFKVREVQFENESQVKAFMIEQQLGRRNLTPSQLQYLRGIKYNTIVGLNTQQKNRVLEEKSNRERTCEYLAKKFSISKTTILRDAEYAKGMEMIGRVNKLLKEEILRGSQKISRKDIESLAQVRDLRTLGKPKTVHDIKHKLHKIRQSYDKDGAELQRRQEREEEFNAINAAFNQHLLDPDAKLNDLKGKVLSAMKQAIEKRSVRPIQKAISALKEMEAILLVEK